MKNKLLLIIPFLLVLTSCEGDFDEIADTQQRHINFIFNTDELFTDVLSKTNDGYSLIKLMSLPTDYLLRITAYGYDLSDNLIFTKTMLLDDLTSQSLKVRHLLQSEEYRFIFIADIVKSDPYVDYYETWFQLGTKRWSDFYVYSERRHDEAGLNCMASSRMIISPDNQDVEVNFNSITYNGFCAFENLEGVDRLSGYVMNTSTFNMKTGSWQIRNSLLYSFDEWRPDASGYVKPISACNADSVITIKLRTLTLQGADSTFINIPNKDRRPFVATFNCEELSLVQCDFY